MKKETKQYAGSQIIPCVAEAFAFILSFGLYDVL
jgi:hypothetical protein